MLLDECFMYDMASSTQPKKREECLLRRVAVIGNRRAAAADAAIDAVPAKR